MCSILEPRMLDHLTEHPDIDPGRYAEHTATVLLDGVAEPSGRPSPQQ